MHRVLRQPRGLLPDAGPAQTGPGGRQDRRQPRPGVQQGVDQVSGVTLHS